MAIAVKYCHNILQWYQCNRIKFHNQEVDAPQLCDLFSKWWQIKMVWKNCSIMGITISPKQNVTFSNLLYKYLSIMATTWLSQIFNLWITFSVNLNLNIHCVKSLLTFLHFVKMQHFGGSAILRISKFIDFFVERHVLQYCSFVYSPPNTNYSSINCYM